MKIAAIGPDAFETVPALMLLIGDDVTEVRVAGLNALAVMGSKAKAAVPLAADLFDRDRTPAPVLVAAVKVLAVGGVDGLDRLETLSRKSLPEPVREELCRAFAKAATLSEATRTWMIEQAENTQSVREAISAALAKTGTSTTIQELIRRTNVYKPRKSGEKDVKYPVDYRKWVLIALRKMDVPKIATRETRRELIDRLEYLVKNEGEPEIVAEAKAALEAVKK